GTIWRALMPVSARLPVTATRSLPMDGLGESSNTLVVLLRTRPLWRVNVAGLEMLGSPGERTALVRVTGSLIEPPPPRIAPGRTSTPPAVFAPSTSKTPALTVVGPE